LKKEREKNELRKKQLKNKEDERIRKEKSMWSYSVLHLGVFYEYRVLLLKTIFLNTIQFFCRKSTRGRLVSSSDFGIE
jgi:hypothetical protein